MENMCTTDPQGLKPGAMILRTRIRFEFMEGEGPFLSLRNLKRNSRIYKQLKQQNPKRAQKIIQEHHIGKSAGGFSTPPGSKYHPDVISLFTHCTKGRVKNGNITGVHFYDPFKVKIIKIHDKDLNTGVFEAEFQYYDNPTKKWLKKSSNSTFFPTYWTRGIFLAELQYAHDNLEGYFPESGKVTSKTSEGIAVEFVFKNSKLISVYPLMN